jgi:hypothetical protein
MIATHNLFIDFKAAYDTIIRNECSGQADMERFSSTGLNQVLVVVPHKEVSQ